jgi:prepilin-type processing-associated H-X9-DG protein
VAGVDRGTVGAGISLSPARPAPEEKRYLTPLSGARSHHSGGVNTSMCDGSVRFIKDSVNLLTWMALSTTKGGEIISADAY